jgi:hypothetical protein
MAVIRKSFSQRDKQKARDYFARCHNVHKCAREFRASRSTVRGSYSVLSTPCNYLAFALMIMLPTLDELAPIFAGNTECINYLQSKGVFYTTLVCPTCGNRIRNVGNRGDLRCVLKECRKKLYIRVHTFFCGSALPCNSIMRLAYLWLAKLKHESIMLLTGHGSVTLSAFMAHF